jgi:hypothetical protein
MDPVQDLMDKLKAFLAMSRPANLWLENDVMRAYCRKSRRVLSSSGKATLVVDEDYRGRGLMTDFIRRAHEANPYEFTVLENVLNKRFMKRMLGMGWTRSSLYGMDDVLYMPTGRKA